MKLIPASFLMLMASLLLISAAVFYWLGRTQAEARYQMCLSYEALKADVSNIYELENPEKIESKCRNRKTVK